MDWRPFTSRKRWQDGKRGWTGLSEEEVRGDDIKARGENVRSDKISWAVVKKVMRAKFAREFPRGADRRICAASTARGRGAKEYKERAAKEMSDDKQLCAEVEYRFCFASSSDE